MMFDHPEMFDHGKGIDISVLSLTSPAESSDFSILWTHLPMQETQEKWFPSPGWEDPLEQEMATHSNILAWIIPWAEEPGGLQSMRSQRVGYD